MFKSTGLFQSVNLFALLCTGEQDLFTGKRGYPLRILGAIGDDMDIKTLLFAMFLSMVLGTIALFFFAMINRGSKALWLWMLSQLAEALAAVVFMMRGVMPEALNIF